MFQFAVNCFEHELIGDSRIDYFYKFDYEDHNDDATQDTIEINAQVLAVADKYDVEGLMMLADAKYSTGALHELCGSCRGCRNH